MLSSMLNNFLVSMSGSCMSDAGVVVQGVADQDDPMLPSELKECERACFVPDGTLSRLLATLSFWLFGSRRLVGVAAIPAPNQDCTCPSLNAGALGAVGEGNGGENCSGTRS